MERGYIKLWRKTIDTGLLENPNLFTLWAWCLMKATRLARTQMVGNQAVDLEPGQFVFGRYAAMKELKQSEKIIRNGMKALEKLNMIGRKRATKFSVVSIVNWATYQQDHIQEGPSKGHQGADKGPTRGHKQEVKKLRIKEVKKDPKPPAVEIPESLQTDSFKTAWTEFEEYRKENRLKPYKPRGQKQLFKKLAEWGEPRAVAAIYYSMSQNYQGIYEEKGGNGKQQPDIKPPVPGKDYSLKL